MQFYSYEKSIIIGFIVRNFTEARYYLEVIEKNYNVVSNEILSPIEG